MTWQFKDYSGWNKCGPKPNRRMGVNLERFGKPSPCDPAALLKGWLLHFWFWPFCWHVGRVFDSATGCEVVGWIH